MAHQFTCSGNDLVIGYWKNQVPLQMTYMDHQFICSGNDLVIGYWKDQVPL